MNERPKGPHEHACGRFRIGTSGYQYDHWRGVLYPKKLPKRVWFERYAEAFDTVEINNTFYRLPGEDTFDSWRERAPEGFLYALKFNRFGTHMKHLREPEGTIGLFMERARRLGPFLGPVLVQLPPRWTADPPRLRDFLAEAPTDVRWTVELRNRSWLNDEVYEILREAGAALCIHDILRDHPRVHTAGWTYLRYHGSGYGGGYTHQKLTWDARRIAGELEEGRDVYAYFNNDRDGHAVRDAETLRWFVERRVGAAREA